MQAVATQLNAASADRPVPLKLAEPLRVTLQTQTAAQADLFCQWPTLTRTGGDGLAFDAADIETAVRMLNCLSAMSTMLR